MKSALAHDAETRSGAVTEQQRLAEVLDAARNDAFVERIDSRKSENHLFFDDLRHPVVVAAAVVTVLACDRWRAGRPAADPDTRLGGRRWYAPR